MVRKLISYLLVTLGGVVKVEAVRDAMIELRDDEVMNDFAAKLAAEDAHKGVVILTYRPLISG